VLVIWERDSGENVAGGRNNKHWVALTSDAAGLRPAGLRVGRRGQLSRGGPGRKTERKKKIGVRIIHINRGILRLGEVDMGFPKKAGRREKGEAETGEGERRTP